MCIIKKRNDGDNMNLRRRTGNQRITKEAHDSTGHFKHEGGSRKFAFQSSCGLTSSLSQLSPKSHRTLEGIVRRALDTEAEGTNLQNARYFAQHSRNDMAELNRRSIPVTEQALVEEVARWLFSDMVSRRREASPSRLVTHCLLDELDWRFPSRYAASKALKRTAEEKGFSSPLSESDLSKLENTGQGVSVGRISETMSLLNVNIFLRPYFGAARLCLYNSPPSHHISNGMPKSEASSDSVPYAILRKALFDALIQEMEFGNEPLLILAPFSIVLRITRLIPVYPWSDNEELWKSKISLFRDQLAESQGVSVNQIEIAPAESREVLTWDARSIPKGTALLVSLLDLGSPLLANSNPVSPESQSGGKETPILVRKLKNAFDKLTDSFGALDLFMAHADIATHLASTPSREEPRVLGPLPRGLALGGTQSAHLLIHMVELLSQIGYDFKKKE